MNDDAAAHPDQSDPVQPEVVLPAALQGEASRLERRSEELMLAGDGEGSMTALEQAILLTIDSNDPVLASQGRDLLSKKAASLNAMGAYDGAVQEYTKLAAAAANTAEGLQSLHVVTAWNGKAVALANLLQYEAAIAAFDTVINGFADDRHSRVREFVASGLFNKATLIRDLGDDDPGPAFDAVVRFVDDHPAAELMQWAALALYNKAGYLITIGDVPAALEVYQLVSSSFAASPSEVAVERAARAARLRAGYLAAADATAAAIAGFRDTVDRFADSNVPAVRAEAAEALLSLASLLAKQHRSAESGSAAGEFDRRFGADPDPAVQQVVAGAAVTPIARVAHALRDPILQAEHNQSRERFVRRVLAGYGIAVAGIVAVITVLLIRPARRYLLATAVAGGVATLEFRRWRRTRIAVDHLTVSYQRAHSKDEAQAALDAQARQILTEHEETGRPYALFLRSFDLEGGRSLVHEGALPQWVSSGSRA